MGNVCMGGGAGGAVEEVSPEEAERRRAERAAAAQKRLDDENKRGLQKGSRATTSVSASPKMGGGVTKEDAIANAWARES